MFSIYNATLVAVMQVGIIVAGVLASGLWRRYSAVNHMPMPFAAGLLYDFSVIGFVIPFAWLTFALLLRRSPRVSDDMKGLAFWCGILLLIALVIFVLYADVSPFFNIMWNPGGGDDA